VSPASLSVAQVREEIALDLIAFAEWPVVRSRSARGAVGADSLVFTCTLCLKKDRHESIAPLGTVLVDKMARKVIGSNSVSWCSRAAEIVCDFARKITLS